MYIIKWVDYEGNEHSKTYKRVETAMKKVFAIKGWFKNGQLYRNDERII